MEISRFTFDTHELLPVPVLSDNFVYLICRGGQAVLVDAGEAKPVLKVLEQESLQLIDILITHTHNDHIAGCRALQDHLGVQSTSPGQEEREWSLLGTPCRSVSTPGHMAVHKAYHFPELGVVFSGDALINGACGRLLGGTAEQLFNSLQWIKGLPDETRIFGGHDYLVDNLAFAASVEPENTAVADRLALYRENSSAAIFATVAEEKKTNPFLRAETVEQFAALRQQKDIF